MTNAQVRTVDVHELKKQYDYTPNLCLIDVREIDEWQTIHIPGAIHIPKDTLVEVIDVKVPDKNCPIYLYCRGGIRSLTAANYLLEMGYQQVYSVNGGIVEWANAGYPVQR